ncbi:MAG: polysaccharide pyruvyl transferase family protein, partial [Clostridiales bacterium]|nr:polysaccharide pyruvyl transferase family protein [Clostridiales bacterium]
VRIVTTRDGEWGVERLKGHYISREGILSAKAGDPGLWAPLVYGIEKQDSGVLGINVIRPEIFAAYGNRAGEKEMLEFYSELIRCLEEAGRPWALFTNGVDRDFKFAQKLVNRLGLEPNRLLPKPESAAELVRTVSGFGLVLGVRLHACIAAAALSIPVAGLMWDDKLRFFARVLDRENCFMEVDEADPDRALTLLSEADKTPIDTGSISRLALQTRDGIRQFMHIVDLEKRDLLHSSGIMMST